MGLIPAVAAVLTVKVKALRTWDFGLCWDLF